ncbi:Colicin-M [Klebsiella pneumoniae]|uniref:lipid II-degrading bacteriocin n=1 Tax=Klebsiella pneumoniae TaxID=573 RepID=UPI000DE6DCE0|nr:lipid II-degrading bacteriocin [Klebsiella pneumoniae]SSF99763.1 Colicin-M [Klebsiella pneumoniae]
MSETMVVVAPPTGFEPAGYGGGLFSPSTPNNSPSQGQIFLQVTLPYYQSAKFCQDSMAWLAQYVKTHGATDPLTIQVVANNIRYFLNADTNLCHNPRQNVWEAFHSEMTGSGPAPAKYDYKSMSLKQMSGNVVTPAAAFGHYLWGNGEERYVNLPDVGLKITPQQIPELMNIVNSGVTGNIPVDLNFNHNTYDSGGVIPASYLGNVSLRTIGSLNIQNSGEWTYNGVVRAYNDYYDFNLGDYRGAIAESLTYLGAQFSGKPYHIAMPGEINISGAGHR